MPTPGPWISRSPTAFDTGSIAGSTAETSRAITQFALGSLADGPAGVSTGRGSTFTDASEHTNGAISGPAQFYSDPTTSTTLRTDTAAIDFWTTGQLMVLLAWPLFRSALDLTYTGAMPPGAVGVEYEYPDGSASSLPDANDPAVLLAAAVELTTSVNRSTVGSPINDPTAMTLDMRQTADGVLAWKAGATLSGLTLTDTEPSPATADTAVTLAGTLNVASRPTLSFPFTEAAYWQMILHHHEQITHVAPTTGAIVTGPLSDVGWGASLSKLASVRATGSYQPPRYRFLYAALPRLRQFPRDDSLGGSPRQGKTNGATSVQGSTRQGWRGTYR